MNTHRLPVALALLAAACIAPSAPEDGGVGAPVAGPVADRDPWSPDFEPPRVLATARVRLEPLAPRHAELDFAALMESREHLRRTLRWGDWPRADFTLEENRGDLERHWREFEDREGYAYTVLAPDRSRCLGCVYLVPPRDGAGRDAMLAYWVSEPALATDLDAHLLGSVLAWIERDWPFERVAIPNHPDNARGARIGAEAGLTAAEDGSVLVWRRSE